MSAIYMPHDLTGVVIKIHLLQLGALCCSHNLKSYLDKNCSILPFSMTNCQL
jgi:hypothetical protein